MSGIKMIFSRDRKLMMEMVMKLLSQVGKLIRVEESYVIYNLRGFLRGY